MACSCSKNKSSIKSKNVVKSNVNKGKIVSPKGSLKRVRRSAY